MFKGKSKNVLKQAQGRKGKIIFNAKYQNKKVDLTISYTRASLTGWRARRIHLNLRIWIRSRTNDAYYK